MFSIFYSKFLRYLEDTPSINLFISFAKLFTWSIICISLFNIPKAIENFTMAIKWHDFAILKIIGSFIIVFYAKDILKIGKSILSWIIESINEWYIGNNDEPMYKNIPLIELVDYLMTSDIFSRSDFCTRFAVSRKVFDDLAEWFDTIGVFVRWENNARVLNSSYSRSDIASILTRAIETWEIRPLMRKTEKWYTHSPTFQTIPLSHFTKSAS